MNAFVDTSSGRNWRRRVKNELLSSRLEKNRCTNELDNNAMCCVCNERKCVTSLANGHILVKTTAPFSLGHKMIRLHVIWFLNISHTPFIQCHKKYHFSKLIPDMHESLNPSYNAIQWSYHSTIVYCTLLSSIRKHASMRAAVDDLLNRLLHIWLRKENQSGKMSYTFTTCLTYTGGNPLDTRTACVC